MSKTINFLTKNIGYQFKKITRDVRPISIQFEITGNCNSKCVMCNFWKTNNKNELTLQEITKLFTKNTFCNNLESVTLTGGEVLLRTDIGEIAKTIYLNTNIKVSISTNGLIPVLLKKLLDNYGEYISGIGFSVDGIGADYKLNRGIGKEGFERVVRSIEIAKEYGYNPTIGVTVTKYNLHCFEKVSAYFKGYHVTIKPAQESKEYYGNNIGGGFGLNQEEIKVFLKKIKNLSEHYYERYLPNYLLNKERLRCYAGSFEMFINSFGEIHPCMHKFSFGNIRSQPIEEIWFGAHSKVFRKLYKNCNCCYERCTTTGYQIDGIKWKYKTDEVGK